MFHMPEYREPDFTKERFANAPDAAWEKVTIKGVAPENYHSTSMYPEYFKIDGQWKLAKESRMDSSVVLGEDGELRVVENRNLQVGDKVILGRTENAVLKTRKREKATSLSSVRAEAVRLPTPETMTACLNC